MNPYLKLLGLDEEEENPYLRLVGITGPPPGPKLPGNLAKSPAAAGLTDLGTTDVEAPSTWDRWSSKIASNAFGPVIGLSEMMGGLAEDTGLDVLFPGAETPHGMREALRERAQEIEDQALLADPEGGMGRAVALTAGEIGSGIPGPSLLLGAGAGAAGSKIAGAAGLGRTGQLLTGAGAGAAEQGLENLGDTVDRPWNERAASVGMGMALGLAGAARGGPDVRLPGAADAASEIVDDVYVPAHPEATGAEVAAALERARRSGFRQAPAAEPAFDALARENGLDPRNMGAADEAWLHKELLARERAADAPPTDVRPDIEPDMDKGVYRVGEREFPSAWQAQAYRDTLSPETGMGPPELTLERWQELRAQRDFLTSPPAREAAQAAEFGGDPLAARYLQAGREGAGGDLARAAEADALEGAAAVPIRHPLAPEPLSAEAGSLLIRSAPPPAPRPIRKYMLEEQPRRSGADFLRDLKRRWLQQVTNADDPIERYARIGRKGPAKAEARALELQVAALRGVAESARGPIERGTRLWNGSGYTYTGESLHNIFGGLDDLTLRDLEDFNASRRQIELADRRAKADSDYAAAQFAREQEIKKLRQESVAQRRQVRETEAEYRQRLAREIKAAKAQARAGKARDLSIDPRTPARAGRKITAQQRLSQLRMEAGRAQGEARAKLREAITAGRAVAPAEVKRRLREWPKPVDRSAFGDLDLEIDPRATADAQATLADIAGTWGQRLPELEGLAQRYQGWKIRAVLDPLVEVGKLSPAARQSIVDSNQHHAMFDRALDGVYASILDEQVQAGSLSREEAVTRYFGRKKADKVAGVVTAGKTSGDPLKRIGAGLSENIAGLVNRTLENDVTRVQAITRWVERQRLRNMLADLADADPAVAREIVPSGKKNAAEPFLSKEEFQAWRDGESRSYVAPGDTLHALERLSPAQAHLAFRIARFPAALVRTTATLGLEFMARNPVRDVVSAMVSSPSGFLPQDFVTGLFARLGADRFAPMVKEFRDAGGAMSSLVSLDREAAQATLADAAQGKGALEATRGFLRHWREAVVQDPAGGLLYPLQNVSSVLEEATRLGVYMNARKGGRKQVAGLPIPFTRGKAKSMAEAALEARDSTVDFGRAGESGKVVNALYAFANAEIQDVSKLYRNFRDRPVATATRIMAYVVVPSAMVWQMNRSNPEYEQREEWEKVSFLHLWKLPDGSTFKLPRVQGMLNALFSYGVEKLLDRMAGEDPRATERLVEGLTELTPAHWMKPTDLWPTGIKPISEAAVNLDTWRNVPIDPRSEQKGLPQYRGEFDERLPQVFKDAAVKIHEALPASAPESVREAITPYKLQHIFRGYTTSIGRYATDALSRASRDEATALPTTAADVPGIRAFVARRPIGWSSKPVSDLYYVNRIAGQAADDLKEFKKHGRPDDYLKVFADHPEARYLQRPVPGTPYSVPQAIARLNELKKKRNMIRTAPGLSPEERADLLAQMDQAATVFSATFMERLGGVLP